jgi:retinol dehydrogenase 12
VQIESCDMRGRVCLVTGATSGLGLGTAQGLARAGAQVVLVGRSAARLAAAKAHIIQETPQAQIEIIQADLSALSEVHRTAESFLEEHDRLDVLVNNVGATMLRYQESPDGYELTWALNFLGHFLMSHSLLEVLKTTAQQQGEARIVEITSSVYRLSDPDFRVLQGPNQYQGIKAYAQSKRAMLVYTGELARRMAGSSVTINAVTPGVVKTNMASGNGFFASLAMEVVNTFATPLHEGVKPILRVACSPELQGCSGAYFKKYKQMPADPAIHDSEVIRRVWKMAEEQVGMPQSS